SRSRTGLMYSEDGAAISSKMAQRSRRRWRASGDGGAGLAPAVIRWSWSNITGEDGGARDGDEEK
ncbi:hypothetical protein U1Q18_018707, partial [Sarracenia purpurea var. burkii]